MRVDEAGCDERSARVDDLGPLPPRRRGRTGADRGDPAVLEYDVPGLVLGSRRVDARDVPALDDRACHRHSSSSTAVSSAASIERIHPSFSAVFFSS